MAEAAHLLAVVAGEHIGEVRDAEAHLGAEGGGEQFARDLGRVDRRRRFQAIVAIAAARRRVFAEMPQQDRAAAVGASTSAASAFSRSRSPARRSGSTSVSIRRRASAKSSAAQNSQRFGRIAVAPGAAGLLVIGLDRLGDAGMGDEAHVGLVDAHAERDRRHDHHVFRLTNAAWLRARTRGSSPA